MPSTTITYTIAFFAGITTFFASCLLPLVPLYLMYLTNLSMDRLVKGHKMRILKTSILFTCGFVLMFVLMGAGIGIVGKFLAPYAPITNRAIGVIFILLGLSSLNIIPMHFLPQREIDTSSQFGLGDDRGAFLIGIAFALAWTPCIGPVLSIILYWSSQQETILQGTTLLILYGIGLGLPFVITGLLFKTISPLLRKLGKFGLLLQYVSALLIMGIGLLMLLGYFQHFSLVILQKVGLNKFAQ
ncbi:MAG: cytochrome c biogenesis protein CcdA [Candidatus Roizmanbacteria bacterium]|nr:cytochrome c biogenesis protein CcdA [Candidatus Roizmanbacteria bacterium]